MKLGRKKFNWKDRAALCILGISMLLFITSILYANTSGAYWTGGSTGYDYSGLNEAWAYVAYYAQATWNNSGMEFSIYYDQYSNNDVSVYISADGYYGFTFWYPTTGALSYADIYYNYYYTDPSYGAGYPGYNRVDGQSVATHELGHFLGLAHDSSGSAMYPSYAPNWTWMRSLNADDLTDIRNLY